MIGRLSRLLNPVAGVGGALLASALLAACEGENLFDTGGGAFDAREPEVEIEAPDSGQRVAVGDSVLVRVRVIDDAGIAQVDLTGFAVSGSAELGTLVATPRFVPKLVDLQEEEPLVRDTVLLRYLNATTDSVPADTVLLIARVTDLTGNVSADTIEIEIGGPRVHIVAPQTGEQVRPGGQIAVQIVAADTANRLQSLQLLASGPFAADVTLRFDPPRGTVDTIVALDVPETAGTGALRLMAVARNTLNDSTVSPTVDIQVLPPATDTDPPEVRFETASRTRVETGDTFTVTVVAEDEVRVSRVGATLVATLRLPTSTDTVGAIPLSQSGDSATFRVSLESLGVVEPDDSVTLRIETTAFAFDAVGNCATAVVPDTDLSNPCVLRGDTVFATTSGARTEVLLVRGTTARPSSAGDRFADLVVDQAGQRVFVSNFNRNRVEVLPFGSRTFSGSVSVGAEPWGVTLGVSRDTLFVANSAGTNISVVPLNTLQEIDSRRIRPPDVRLYGVEYDVETDSVDVVTIHDYSDRPQFIGQISSGQFIYSTLPTSVRDPGTIRIIDPAKDDAQGRDEDARFNRGSEIFVGYADEVIGRAIVVNALDAGLALNRTITVCPRAIRAGEGDPACVNGTATQVHNALVSLASAGLTDTRLDLGRDVESVALTDTTFVAVSVDNSTIAFGEGAAAPGRVFLFRDEGGALEGTSRETEDLLGNAAEAVIGLALNGDGTLGGAKGDRAYFFNQNLRLEGQSQSGSPPATGGIALHPLDVNYPNGPGGMRRAFVSAVDAAGVPFIDIVDTFTFESIRRVYIRDRIVGTLAAVEENSESPNPDAVAIRLFGISASGVVEIEIKNSDLVR